MNKKRLAEKGKTLQDFEEQTLNSVKERFAKYNSELDKMGLALDIELLWYYRYGELMFSRIDFKNGYTCAICLQVRNKNEPMHDMDLEAINAIQPITKIYWPIYWIRTVFSKIPTKILKEYLDDSESIVKKIIDKGYEKVLEEIRLQDK